MADADEVFICARQGDKALVFRLDRREGNRVAHCPRLQGNSAFNVVGEADDGDNALQLIATLKPTIIILDIAMPGRSGLEVTGEFRRRRMPGELNFLTAYKDLDNLEVKGYALAGAPHLFGQCAQFLLSAAGIKRSFPL